MSEYVCMKAETSEIKLSVGNIITKGKGEIGQILEKGKEIGLKQAQKIMSSTIQKESTKKVSKKKKDKSEDV